MGTIFTILAYGLLAWFIYTRFAPLKGLNNLDANQFADKMKSNSILVDVREPHEFKSGYISGALNIPLSQLSKRAGEIPKDKEVLLYCRSGMRSKQAARIIKKQGISNVSHLKGGILAWNGNVKK
jgi:rhodanese-related sulfurtransferase